MTSSPLINDQQFVEFLNALAADVKSKNGVLLTAWESDFLGTFLGLPTGAFHFTEGRRAAVDRMWRRYGAEINHPHPLDEVTERPKLPDADPSGCQFIVRDEERRQRRCNEPATCREPGRLRYCELHGEEVRKAMKIAGQSIALVRFP